MDETTSAAVPRLYSREQQVWRVRVSTTVLLRLSDRRVIVVVLALSAILQRNATEPWRLSFSSGCVLRGHRVNAAYKGGAGFILPPLVAIVRSFVIRIPSKAALSAVINVTRDILGEWNESSKPSVFLLPSKSFPLCFTPSFSLVLQVFLRSSRRREPLQGRGEGRRRIGETRTDIRFLFDDGFAPLEWMSE